MSYGLLDIAKDTFNGTVQYAETELQQRRIALCRQCPLLISSFFDNIGQCSKCGCYISHKVKYSQTNCPNNLW